MDDEKKAKGRKRKTKSSTRADVRGWCPIQTGNVSLEHLVSHGAVCVKYAKQDLTEPEQYLVCALSGSNYVESHDMGLNPGPTPMEMGLKEALPHR